MEGYVDALVVDAWDDADGGAGEFGGELVEAARRDALVGAVDVVGGDGRVVGGLLGEVGDADSLVLGAVAFGGYGGLLEVLLDFFALEARFVVFHFPVTSEELAECAVVGFAWLALDVLEIFCEPKS